MTSLSAPLYRQVFSIIHQRIVEGTYPPGSRLKSEDELAAEFKVSRPTVRQAVGELVSQGLLSRQQGRGTFVEPTASRILGQRYRGSLAALVAETKRTRIREVKVRKDVEVPSRIAEALGLAEARGTIVQRSRTIDGRAFAYTINYLPPDIGEMVTENELKRASLLTILMDKGISFGRADQTIRAQLADVNVSTWLDATFEVPVLFVERLMKDTHERPVEFVQTWYRGDRYEYSVSLDLGTADSSVDINPLFA